MKRKMILVLVLLAALVLLTGCGEKDKYDKAAALAAEGKYYEAYTAFLELGKYEDAADKAAEMKETIINAASTALAEGRFEEAATYAAYFPDAKQMSTVAAYAEMAKNGTYVSGLKLSEDGKISFTAAIGPDAGDENGPAKVQVLLQVHANGRAAGKVWTGDKPEETTKEGYFVPEEYLKDGKYVIEDVPLGSWLYNAEADKLALKDFYELGESSLDTIRMFQMAKFTLGYEGVMLDGTKCVILSMWTCSGLEFRDIMGTFAGGTVSAQIVSSDRSKVLFQQTVDIPAAE